MHVQYLYHTVWHNVTPIIPSCPELFSPQVLLILPKPEPFQCPPKLAVEGMSFFIISLVWASRSPQVGGRHQNDARSTNTVRTAIGATEPGKLLTLTVAIRVVSNVKGFTGKISFLNSFNPYIEFAVPCSSSSWPAPM